MSEERSTALASIVGQRSATVAADQDSARAIAEVQASVIMARRFPRDEALALERIQTACRRPGLARRALYQYARGGTDISGPSIRLAEAVAQRWGNITFGMRELEQRDGCSTVEAYAWDLESNTRRTIAFQVPHVRDTKAGRKPITDARDIYEMVANQAARRVRACIMGVVPGDVFDEARTVVDEVLASDAEVTPDRVAAMASAFAAIGVTAPMIEARIQRKLAAITPQYMSQLRRIYSSLQDGMSKIEDWFTATTGATRAEATAAKGAKKDTLYRQTAPVEPSTEAMAPAPDPAPVEQPPSDDPSVGARDRLAAEVAKLPRPRAVVFRQKVLYGKDIQQMADVDALGYLEVLRDGDW